MSKVGIFGAGTWGIALARVLTNCGHEVTVWSAISEEIEVLSTTRRQTNLPDVVIPAETKFTTHVEEVCKGKDILYLQFRLCLQGQLHDLQHLMYRMSKSLLM